MPTAEITEGSYIGRLIDPGVGEVSDRLSILVLKILFGEQAGKEVGHFKKEKAVLLTKLRAQPNLNGGWFEGYSELAAVNAALWHAEDDLREAHGHWWTTPDSTGLSGTEGNRRVADQVAPLAFRIQALNDRRATLIAQINAATGDATGPEKLA